MFFVSFTKGPGSFPYVLIITAKVPTLIPIDGITLVDHRVFVLGEYQEVFDGAATFEVSLDVIPSTDVFDTFTKTLCVGYNNMALTLNFSSGRGVLVVPLLLAPSFASLEGLDKRLQSRPSSEANDGANNNGTTSTPLPLEKLRVRAILLYPTHKVFVKVSKTSVEGMTSKLTSKVAAPSKTSWYSPRTKTLWSTKVMPSIGINVGTLAVMMST